jgi:hypothetical protein
MKRALPVLAAALGMLVLGLILTGLFPLRGQGNLQPGKQVQKWEYGLVSYVAGKGVSWESPEKVVVAETFEDLNVKLGLARNANQSDLFTHLGADGWELVSHSMRTVSGPASGMHAVWTFKRAVKPTS